MVKSDGSCEQVLSQQYCVPPVACKPISSALGRRKRDFFPAPQIVSVER